MDGARLLPFVQVAVAAFCMSTSKEAWAKGGSLTYCDERHEWARALAHRRTLVLGVLYPSDQLLASLSPAIDLAVEDIRSHECILTRYNITVSPSNTGCKAAKGMKALFSMMHDSPKKVALFGDACESVNEPVAAAAKSWNIMQLSYYETHPKFTLGTESQELYRTFYRIVPGVYSEQMAQLSFVKRFGWKRFGLVVQTNEERFNLPHGRRGRIFGDENGFSIAASTQFSTGESNYAAALSKLKNISARIIIGDFNMSSAGAIFCEAYRQNLTGARHVWILSSQHTRISVNKSAEDGNCKAEELQSALRGHFVFQFAPIRMDSPGSDYVKDADTYMRRYEYRCRKRAGCDVNNPFHAYAYDGIWTLALAMDAGIKEQLETEHGFFDPQHDLVDYDRWSNRLALALSNNTFEGVTGKVQFHSSNERLGRIRILQYRDEQYVPVGEYDAATDSLIIPNETALFFWTPDGLPPPDAIRRDNQMEHIDFPVFCVMCALTAFGIVLALCFLSVNVYFRNHRFIKMSSPNMNNLIIGGSILTYVSVVLLGVDTRVADVSTYNAVCTAKVGILSVGFSLAFGSMFSKTWRVHSIFTNIKLNKKAIKDYKLFLIVFALFLVDTIILSVWIFVSPLSRREGVLMNDTNEQMNILITRFREYCASDHMSIFQGLLFGYKGILLILGCFLAWETRHVNVPALNDSKYIGMSVYNVVLMCALGVAILFILENNVNASYVLISLFIIFCTTLTLCLVFVPKVVELARNPKGTGADKRYRQAMMKSVGTERKLSEGEQESHKDHLVRMEQDNQVWRKMLEDKKTEIAELLKRLQTYGQVTADLSSLPKETTSQLSHSSIPDDPYGGVYLGPPGPSCAEKQEQHQRQQLQKQQDAPSQAPSCLPKSPTPEEMSETTSLLKRSSAASFRDKLFKLRTSFSRSSMPATFNVDAHMAVFTPDSLPIGRAGSSVYQSLHELGADGIGPEEGVSNARVVSCGGDLRSGHYGHRVSTSNSSDTTEDDEDAEDGSSSGGGPRRLRYVDPSLIPEEPPELERRALPSIRESRLVAFDDALSSSESAADDEDELLLDEQSEQDPGEWPREEDALL